MAQTAKLLQDTLATFEKLSFSARRQLAEKLLSRFRPSPRTVLIAFEQFDPAVEARLHFLMDRSNKGTLSRTERRELADLVQEHQRMMLANSHALLRVSHPNLFDAMGRLVPMRLDKAVDEKARWLRARRVSKRLSKPARSK